MTPNLGPGRTARQAVNGLTTITPRYPFGVTGTTPATRGGIQTGENYRQGLARQITADIQFSRAAVNLRCIIGTGYGFDRECICGIVNDDNSIRHTTLTHAHDDMSETFDLICSRANRDPCGVA